MTWYPGCEGCCAAKQFEPCLIFVDDFNDGVIDPQWVQEAGSWLEGGGYLSTNSENAFISSNRGVNENRLISADVFGTDVGSVASLRGWVGEFGSGEYGEARLEFGEEGVQYGRLIFAIKGGGSPDETIQYCWTDVGNIDDWVRLQYCSSLQDFETGGAYILDSAGNIIAYTPGATGPAVGSKCGLGTRDNHGQIRFDNYRELITRGNAPYGHCPACLAQSTCFAALPSNECMFVNGFAPTFWKIDLAGFVAFQCPNTDCETQVNATYVLESDLGFGGACRGSMFLSNPSLCQNALEQWSLSITVARTGAYGVQIDIEVYEKPFFVSGTYVARFQKIWPDGVKARDIENIDIPLNSSGQLQCDGTNATCTLTAQFI